MDNEDTANFSIKAPNKIPGFNFAPPPSFLRKMGNDEVNKMETNTVKVPNKIPGLNLNFPPPPNMLKNMANGELRGKDSSVTQNKIPGFNFPPPPSMLTKDNNVQMSMQARVLSNPKNKSYDQLLNNVRPIDVARRLNFSHLKELEEHLIKDEPMEETPSEDMDDEPIDLTPCIIPPEERKRLLKMDEEKRLKEAASTEKFDSRLNLKKEEKVPNPTPPVKEMKNLHLKSKEPRAHSPPRPRLPCLFEDYEYCLEEQRRQLAEYKEKLKTQKMSGIAKVLCFEIPRFPVPDIDFQLLPPPPSHIKVFKFDTPSPDELYRLEQEKNKNKVRKPMFLVP